MAEEYNGPRAIVVKRGRVSKAVKTLKLNLRQVLEPHTASKLRDKESNSVKDFVSMAGPLGITHMLILSSTELGLYLHVAKLPQGPTITFQVSRFSTMNDCVSLNRHRVGANEGSQHSPLVVLTGFPKDEHGQLMSTMFQNMFPPLNIHTMKLSHCKRVALFAYDKETGTIQFRHYLITTSQTAVTKTVKRLIKSQLPNSLKSHNDIADYILGGHATDSEAEDGPESTVDLEGTNEKRFQPGKYAVRLRELGPRMTLSLLKIEDQVCEGKVLYHKYVTKTENEIKEMDRKKEEERRLKEERRLVQEQNVKRKRGELEEDSEDEASWYRKEVGQDPEADELQKFAKGSRFNPMYRKKSKEEGKKKKKQKR